MLTDKSPSYYPYNQPNKEIPQFTQFLAHHYKNKSEEEEDNNLEEEVEGSIEEPNSYNSTNLPDHEEEEPKSGSKEKGEPENTEQSGYSPSDKNTEGFLHTIYRRTKKVVKKITGLPKYFTNYLIGDNNTNVGKEITNLESDTLESKLAPEEEKQIEMAKVTARQDAQIKKESLRKPNPHYTGTFSFGDCNFEIPNNFVPGTKPYKDLQKSKKDRLNKRNT